MADAPFGTRRYYRAARMAQEAAGQEEPTYYADEMEMRKMEVRERRAGGAEEALKRVYGLRKAAMSALEEAETQQYCPTALNIAGAAMQTFGESQGVAAALPGSVRKKLRDDSMEYNGLLSRIGQIQSDCLLSRYDKKKG